jgi:hypothetical protein
MAGWATRSVVHGLAHVEGGSRSVRQTGSTHESRYRLAYIVEGVFAVRYDNEAGKGDHRHFGGKENAYAFQTPEKLIADFERGIARWNRENRNS